MSKNKQEFNEIDLPGLALDLMLLGGQSFCWEKIGDNEYLGFDKDSLIELKYDGNKLYWQTYPELNNKTKIKQYFRLDTDHKPIHELIFADNNVKIAQQNLQTIRLLKQDFEIAFFSFIISQNNSLPIIRYRIKNLCQKFGNQIEYKGKIYHLFPSVESLMKASLAELSECKLGYRAKYVKSGAEFLAQNKAFYTLLKKADTKIEPVIREWLKEVNGIGDKVADCILVYGLGYDNIFPMDLWGRRLISKYYGLPEKAKYEHLRKWIKAHFRGYAAWAGQYLFEYTRLNWKDIKNESKKISNKPLKNRSSSHK